MAWLPYETHLRLDDLIAPVIGVASDFGKHDSQLHQHQHSQLLFAKHGAIHIMTGQILSILSPNRVAYIPPNTMHRVVMYNSVDYRSIYIDAQVYQGMPTEVAIYDTSALIKEVLEQIAFMPFKTNWEKGDPYHLLSLCFSWLNGPSLQQMSLPLPQDKRLQPLVESLALLPPTLTKLTTYVGASEKTIGRIFNREVGMSYQQWRQRWRFIKAVELLATGKNNTDIAQLLDFSSDSAFTTFFKQWSGCTPKQFKK
ncbi:AraC family transcriptional regulator [Neisseria sp. Ec49-e6-T10]|uniref:AraC family transcriptional regulator n=1 Tax=Neisseria sp. Ec49-e6-T10 TaxID=3140744 RepID=UPI003EB73C8B